MQIGIDLVEVPRIAKALNRGNKGFLKTVYTPAEVDYIQQAHASDTRAAGMWAAKEAVVKAFGIGFSEGISFHDVEVRHAPTGQPYAVLAGKLRSWALGRSLQVLSTSISHTDRYAIAVALVGPVLNEPLLTRLSTYCESPDEPK
jgi:holo-[acyl-carrier protein] synthase